MSKTPYSLAIIWSIRKYSTIDERGLRVKEAKTRIFKATQGFDFLGWHFKVLPDGRFNVTSSKKSPKSIKEEVKATMKLSQITLEDRIKYVAEEASEET